MALKVKFLMTAWSANQHNQRLMKHKAEELTSWRAATKAVNWKFPMIVKLLERKTVNELIDGCIRVCEHFDGRMKFITATIKVILSLN